MTFALLVVVLTGVFFWCLKCSRYRRKVRGARHRKA